MRDVIPLTPLPLFGDFKTIRSLGSGHFAETFLARGPDDTDCAIKWLGSGVADAAFKQFDNEKWVLQNLDHPAIPKFLGEGMHEGRPYFRMSFAPGESLRKLAGRQTKELQFSSPLHVLSILIVVLDALDHMHSKGMIHRDVKDANIIANSSVSNVSLIDFGFSTGPGQPQTITWFWYAGAARYSPLTKLEHPNEPHPGEDVFAVGVLGYLLLTNRYPWQGADVGDLRERMRKDRPVPAVRHNPLMTQDFSDFISGLLTQKSKNRPEAAQARDACIELQKRLAEKRSSPAVIGERSIKFPHVVRDPIHGDIRMTDFEWNIFKSREVQRLRWVRQLGFAHLVYPGAEHSRLSHSLGTMYVADKILRYIEDVSGQPFDAEERLAARAVALVHDVTHICYGHTLEDELGLFDRHDQNTGRLERLLHSSKSEVGDVLRSTEYGRQVLAYFDPSSSAFRHTHIRDLIEGPSGPDVVDYIDRDAYFCGLDHRVDSAIFRHYQLVDDHTALSHRHMASRLYGSHGVRLDAEFALESIFLERYALFLKVYTHPAKVAAGAMLGKAMAQAAGKKSIDERTLEWLGDGTLLDRLSESRQQDTRKLAKRLVCRDLFKQAFRATVLGPNELKQDVYVARLEQFKQKKLFGPQNRAAAERRLAEEARLKPSEVVIYCVDRVPGEKKLQHYVEHSPDDVRRIDEIQNPYFRALQRHLSLWITYVFTSRDEGTPEFARLGEAAAKLFGLDNQLSSKPRQRLLF